MLEQYLSSETAGDTKQGLLIGCLLSLSILKYYYNCIYAAWFIPIYIAHKFVNGNTTICYCIFISLHNCLHLLAIS